MAITWLAVRVAAGGSTGPRVSFGRGTVLRLVIGEAAEPVEGLDLSGFFWFPAGFRHGWSQSRSQDFRVDVCHTARLSVGVGADPPLVRAVFTSPGLTFPFGDHRDRGGHRDRQGGGAPDGHVVRRRNRAQSAARRGPAPRRVAQGAAQVLYEEMVSTPTATR